MDPTIRPAANVSRQQFKRVRNAAIATRNQIALLKGKDVRVYLAPRNAGHLGGNHATRQRRLDGFAAMRTIRAHAPIYRRTSFHPMPW